LPHRLAPSFAPVAAAVDGRTLSFVFSTGEVDRYGDTINPNGWQLDNYNKNGMALFGHDAGSVENVIGRGKNVRVQGSKLVGDIEFMDSSINPLADVVYQMIKGGFLNTDSVGFAPIEWKQRSDKSRPGGIDFSKVELLEVSVVPVPALPSSLVQARAAGIDTSNFASWAARQLTKDQPTMPRASLNVISRDFSPPPATRAARPFAEPKSRSTGGLRHFARALVAASVDNTRVDERLDRAGPSGANEVDPTAGGFLIPD
jgi:HK97 family phage prohead protease